MVAASIRLRTPSLPRMLETWTVAVLGLMNSVSAIWALVRPIATSASTSCSRGVRPSAWSGDGVILIPGEDGLLQVPASGGQPQVVLKLDKSPTVAANESEP